MSDILSLFYISDDFGKSFFGLICLILLLDLFLTGAHAIGHIKGSLT